jgi:four helix bundle protein
MPDQNKNLSRENSLKVRTYKFSLAVIDLVNHLPVKRGYMSIGDQLVRSATSIGANLVEAKSASSRKDYIKYFEISLKSANESKYWLCLVRDAFRENDGGADKLLNELTEICNMLGSSIITLKGKR